MKQIVTFKKNNSYFFINYEYEQELHRIMRKHEGKYQKSNTSWRFPLSKLDEIEKDIKNKGYQISISKVTDKGIVIENVFDEPDVIAVLGKCKKCGKGAFVNKQGLCTRCR